MKPPQAPVALKGLSWWRSPYPDGLTNWQIYYVFVCLFVCLFYLFVTVFLIFCFSFLSLFLYIYILFYIHLSIFIYFFFYHTMLTVLCVIKNHAYVEGNTVKSVTNWKDRRTYKVIKERESSFQIHNFTF